jgi:hypothetical protein
MTPVFHQNIALGLISGAILSSDDQSLPNRGEPFHECFSAVEMANYFAIRHDSCRANPKRKESLAKLINKAQLIRLFSFSIL